MEAKGGLSTIEQTKSSPIKFPNKVRFRGCKRKRKGMKQGERLVIAANDIRKKNERRRKPPCSAGNRRQKILALGADNGEPPCSWKKMEGRGKKKEETQPVGKSKILLRGELNKKKRVTSEIKVHVIRVVYQKKNLKTGIWISPAVEKKKRSLCSIGEGRRKTRSKRREHEKKKKTEKSCEHHPIGKGGIRKKTRKTNAIEGGIARSLESDE